MAEESSELNKTAEQANNESLALTGTGGLSNGEYPENRRAAETAYDEKDTEDNETTDETEEIRAKIEDTRNQMSETIDAIQEKLSFSNISEQVKDEVTEKINDALTTAKKTVYDATIRRVGEVMGFINKNFSDVSGTKIVSAARENPLAVTLIGVGLGMLLVNGLRGSSNGSKANGAGRRRSLTSGENQSSILKTAQGKVSGAASQAYGTVSGAASTAYESVGNVASNAYGSVTNAASSAYGSVTNAASSAYGSVTDAASGAYGKAGELSSQAREQYDYYIEENPLAVGAVALALGAAVGLSIPSTQYESQLMGEHRDNLLQKAQESAGGLVDKVKQVASEAQKTFTEEVKGQTA